MKKYLNKYTITALVVLLVLLGIRINIYTDRAYLAECLYNESFKISVRNENTDERLFNYESNLSGEYLTAEAETQIMEYLKTLEAGNAYSQRQRDVYSINDTQSYRITLYSENEGWFDFWISTYERNNYVECSKFVRKLDFNLEFMNYLDSLFVSERSG